MNCVLRSIREPGDIIVYCYKMFCTIRKYSYTPTRLCILNSLSYREPGGQKMSVEVQRKLTVLGYPGVGKTSLTTCFVENRSLDAYHPTIENMFHTTIHFQNAHFVTDIVDTAGMVQSSALYSTHTSTYSLLIGRILQLFTSRFRRRSWIRFSLFNRLEDFLRHN